MKNSWGGIRPDRWNDAAIPGYHDLEMKYLEGPIKECAEGADGHTDTTSCTRSVTPLWDVVLPGRLLIAQGVLVQVSAGLSAHVPPRGFPARRSSRKSSHWSSA